ncbi:MAG: hypothetical protein E7624_03880 [Ruminococcaceae bacterium]|nr:hypothetical protein [Oscillospiraceae bacterium]
MEQATHKRPGLRAREIAPFDMQRCARTRVRTLRPKIRELAHEAQGVSVFAKGEIPVGSKHVGLFFFAKKRKKSGDGSFYNRFTHTAYKSVIFAQKNKKFLYNNTIAKYTVKYYNEINSKERRDYDEIQAFQQIFFRSSVGDRHAAFRLRDLRFLQ